MMKKRPAIRMRFLMALPLAALVGFAAVAQAVQARPRLSSYGHLIIKDPACTVWWAEGAYKVMKSDAVPAGEGRIVRIEAARNEYEPFILVLLPERRLDGVRVAAGSLRKDKGASIDAGAISVCHVEYVKIIMPTDGSGAAGWWPDPLPPYSGPFTAWAAENHPLWFTIRVPKDVAPGIYSGEIRLTAEDWSCDVPVELRVRNFTLPEKSSVRSAFGLDTGLIKAYHNLETREELEKVTDLYFTNMREHRIAPTSPFGLYPIKVATSGVFWKGGEFVTEGVHGGGRAYKVVDSDTARNAAAEYDAPISIAGHTPLRLKLWAKTGETKQRYTVFLQAFDPEGRWIPRANLVKVFGGSPDWKQETVEIPRLPNEARSLRLSLFPTFRDEAGGPTGTAWFDDVVLEAAPRGPEARIENILPGGDFEMPLEKMKVAVDFTDFDRAGRRYLDEFGFNAYDLALQGMGSGSFYSRIAGNFAGFAQGTTEYDTLFSQYLRQVEDHLARNGWLGREYIYWFDEPEEKDYSFVREGMRNIRKNAPRLTRFITEMAPGPAIMDVSEISCTIFHKVDPKVVADLAAKGREFWSYLCTGPKSPWVTLFIDHPAVNLRMWLWMSFAWRLRGILVWQSNYWNSANVFPPGVLQNPWEDPMSYQISYGIAYGAVSPWGNGDGRFFYPPNRNPGRDKSKYLAGPVNSMRWEILREGIEDYEYFVLLERAVKEARSRAGDKKLIEGSAKLLEFPESLFTTGTDYTKDPLDLLRYRSKVADMIERLAAR